MRGAVASALVVMVAAALAGSVVAANYNPGDNGHPTGGPYTDLQGRAGDVTLTFEQTATLFCDGNTATQFNFTLNYTITGAALPAGSTIIVYLSPNQGAINGNANGNDAAYIAAVESNYEPIDMTGRSGTGSITESVNVTTPFQLVTGGVLVVIASDLNGTNATVSWTSKTNSLNCGEAPTPTPTLPQETPTPTPTAQDTPTPTPTLPQETPTPTPTAQDTPTPTPTAQDTPTPTPTLPDTAVPVSGSTTTPDPVGNAFVLLLVGSLASLMFLFLPRKREDPPTI